jgi:molybdate transport system ATP-binding protein
LRIAARLVLLQDGKVVAAGGVERVMGLPQFAAAAGSRSRLTVIAASLLSHDERAKSSCLAFAGGHITVPRLALPVGSTLRARIAADHVIVARQTVAGLSVRNQLPGVVTAINEEHGMVDVEIDIGCPLHAEMTYEACRDLELRPGLAVVALIKAAAIQGESCDLTA